MALEVNRASNFVTALGEKAGGDGRRRGFVTMHYVVLDISQSSYALEDEDDRRELEVGCLAERVIRTRGLGKT